MGFIAHAAETAFQETVDRIKLGMDHGSVNQQPDFDPKQQADLIAQQTDNRTDERFRQALEYHGFVWWPLEKLRRLPWGRRKLEGEWRHQKLGLAYTATDLPRSFAGPEEFDREIRELIAAAKVAGGKLPKSALRRMRLSR